MGLWDRITGVTHLTSDCKCHEPGQLHQVAFKVDGEPVRVLEDKASNEYFVEFNGRTVGQHLSKVEAERLLSAHFELNPNDWLELPEF